MKNVDRVIKTIYLASSDIRSEMMNSLVENILYAWNESISLQDICETITEEFNILPSQNEVRESLNQLKEQGQVVESNRGYVLTPSAKNGVDQKVKQNLQAEQTRYQNFKYVLGQIYAKPLSEKQHSELWQVYNNYINECFLQYQSDAIKMLMPYSMNDENGADLIKQHVSTFEDPICKDIFPNLVTAYPNHLSDADLSYISLIAERAERFYSLGLPEEEYKAATDFSISNWILIADTNVLYSILKLRDHAEGEACLELVRLAKSGLLGFRIVYLPITLKELKTKQHDLTERVIDVKLTPNQIDVLRGSGKLDPFVQPYYDQLALNGQAVTPAERIDKAQYILKNEKVELYNPKQIYDLQENGQYLAQAYTNFYDFERLRNEARLQKGLSERPGKSQLQAEHDILLREVILALRDGKTSLAEVKQIGLTLDDILLRYDRYMIDRNRLPSSTAPSFFLPSMLLRRLRGFIPISTIDYRKAFYRAVSTKTFDPDNKPLSTLVQRSVAYFNALGIDNPQIMMQMLSDEIFLTGFEESDKQGHGQDFVSSEVNKRLTAMEQKFEILEKTLGNAVADKEEQATAFQQREQLLKEEAEKVRAQAQEQIDKQAETIRLVNETHKLEQEELKRNHEATLQEERKQQEIKQRQSLLSAKKSHFQAQDSLKIKIERRAQVVPAQFFLLIGILSSGILLYYWKDIVEMKETIEKYQFFWAIPIFFFVLSAGCFGIKLNIENSRNHILTWYRSRLYRWYEFDLEKYDQLRKEVEQLESALSNYPQTSDGQM